MDINAQAIQASAELASALSQFKTTMFIALCLTVLALALGGTFLVLWFRRAMQRDQAKVAELQRARETEMEQTKQARASLYSAAQLETARGFTSLAATIQSTHEATKAMNQTTVKALSDLGNTISRNSMVLTTVANAVQRMTDKVDGRLSRDDSRKFVAAKLNADVFRTICAVIEKSFIENHYLGREEHIANKVRSRIRDVLVSARSELKDLPLAVSVDPYFPTTTDEEGERFTLCDQIWNKIEHLFQDQRPVQPRMDEAALIVENLVKDHIARVMRRDKKAGDSSPEIDTGALAKLNNPALVPAGAA